MSEIFDVEVSVISQKGNCATGHKVGDKWLVRHSTPDGICLSAYPIMHTSIEVLKYGGTFPWSKDPDMIEAVCPDPDNPVIFQLKRLKKVREGGALHNNMANSKIAGETNISGL